MTVGITELLGQIKAPGTFATRLQVPVDGLDITVAGVGRLKFPLTVRAARKLCEVARPSPFGVRDQTLHDTRVRNSLEIPASRVKIVARQFKPVLTQYLRALRVELGFREGCELEAVFDKLLLYDQGQFFKPHQDSEKHDDMVATLVVLLPSEYSGGVLTVEHGNDTKTFRRLPSQSQDLSLIAFYADCHHAVSPVKSGVRVALSYHLSLQQRSSKTHARPPVGADVLERLTAEVRAHFATPVPRRYSHTESVVPERLVYLLDHQYTQRGLAWNHLKNGDDVRVATLRAVAERLDCECFLALAEVHESWLCEDEDSYPRRYARRGWRYDYDDDEAEEEDIDGEDVDEHELIELIETSIELDHWLDSAGKSVKGITGTVGYEELHFTKPSTDMDPFQSQHEGYQGNYGNTVDRWYHRAAFVMWPRANTFVIRARTSPQWAVDELLALASNDTAAIEAHVKVLLPHWKSIARRVEGTRFPAKLVKLSMRMNNAMLAREWLVPLGMERLSNKTLRRDFVRLVTQHGFPWAKGLIATWTGERDWVRPAWIGILADLCAELRACETTACDDLTTWLLDREMKKARDACMTMLKEPRPWLDLDASKDEAKWLAQVLAAAIAVPALTVLDKAIDLLIAKTPGFPTAFLAQVLLACHARSPALQAYIVKSALYRVCIERLEADLRAPVRNKDDWKIDYQPHCKCVDCKVLAQFLGSNRTEHDWPLNQERRQHVHGTIDRAKLPMQHQTLRQSRPYVLRLRKAPSLSVREQSYKARVKKILLALRAPTST